MVNHTQRRSTEAKKIRMHSMRNNSGLSILEIFLKKNASRQALYMFFKRLNGQHQAIRKMETCRRKPINTPLFIRHLARIKIGDRDSTLASIAKQSP